MSDEMHYLRDQYDDACRRIRQLTSGPGGIMEMKQTIADKEKEIEELKTALRQCYDALEVAFDYDGDDVFGMLHNAAVDASMEAERLLGIRK